MFLVLESEAAILKGEIVDIAFAVVVKGSATTSMICSLVFALALVSSLQADDVAAALGLFLAIVLDEFCFECTLLDLVVFLDLLKLCERLAVSSGSSV